MAADTDIEFRAADLIGPAGVGSNGEKLINTLLDHYPAELQAALTKRINPDLDSKVDDEFRSRVASVAGVSEVEAHVRGGERRPEDAVVTYACLDDQGTVWKGCIPYLDVGKGSSDRHVSQRDSLANSETARQHAAQHPRVKRQPEPQAGQVDAFAALSTMSVEELHAQMDEHPDRVEAIKAFERAARGDKARKGVLDYEPRGSESS